MLRPPAATNKGTPLTSPERDPEISWLSKRRQQGRSLYRVGSHPIGVAQIRSSQQVILLDSPQGRVGHFSSWRWCQRAVTRLSDTEGKFLCSQATPWPPRSVPDFKVKSCDGDDAPSYLSRPQKSWRRMTSCQPSLWIVCPAILPACLHGGTKSPILRRERQLLKLLCLHDKWPVGESEASIGRTGLTGRMALLDWHILDCCSSAEWARRQDASTPGRLDTWSSVPPRLGSCTRQILSDRCCQTCHGRECCGIVYPRDRSQQLSQSRALTSHPIRVCHSGHVLMLLPKRAVASCVECRNNKQPCCRDELLSCHCEEARMGLAGRIPPTRHPPPTTGSSACSRVSCTAAVLGRPSSAPDETMCLASRLANWACYTVSAKNSNSCQLSYSPHGRGI